jgi:phage gpG-like protein
MEMKSAEAILFFNQMQARMADVSPAMNVIASQGWKDVVMHFKDEEGPDGSWKPLKPSTIARRRHGKKKSLGTRILQDTGMLRQSNRWRTVGHNEANVYNQKVYAGVHNYGYSQKNIPKRQFLWTSNKAKQLMQKTLSRWIAKGKVISGI